MSGLSLSFKNLFSCFKCKIEFSPGNLHEDHFQLADLGRVKAAAEICGLLSQGPGSEGCRAGWMLGPTAEVVSWAGQCAHSWCGLVPWAGGEFPREDSFHSLQAFEEPKLGTRTSALVRGMRERP